jgi:hypothetical protein
VSVGRGIEVLTTSSSGSRTSVCVFQFPPEENAMICDVCENYVAQVEDV